MQEPDKRGAPVLMGQTGENLPQGAASLRGDGTLEARVTPSAGVGKASWYSRHLGRTSCVGCSCQRGPTGRRNQGWPGQEGSQPGAQAPRSAFPGFTP